MNPAITILLVDVLAGLAAVALAHAAAYLP